MLSKIKFFLLINALFILLNLPFVVSWEEISENFWAFLFIPIFFAIFLPFPKITKFMFCLLWIPSTVVVFFRFSLGIRMSADIILSFLHTQNDVSLILEYINIYLIIFVLFAGIGISVFICLLKVKQEKYNKKIFFFQYCIIFTGLFIFKICDSRNQVKWHLHEFNGIAFAAYTPLDVIYNSRQAISAIMKVHKVKVLSQEYEYDIKTEDNLKVIFIMGESTRSDRFGINGYERETTPNLRKIHTDFNFINFKSIEACGSMTYISTTCLFSRMTPESYSKTMTETAFTEVLKSRGFAVNIISAQTMIKVYAYLGFDELITQADILRLKKNIDKIKDEYLLKHVEEKLKMPGKSFIMIQLMGAHSAYHERYPKEFEKWNVNPSNPRIEWQRNAYDNAILYTDFVVSEILKLADQEKAIVFFTSDHGESLGENDIWHHGHAHSLSGEKAKELRASLKEQYEVPFFIHLSPNFAKTKQGNIILEKLKKHVGRIDLSHDNIFHTVLGCVGVLNKDPAKPLIDNKLNLCY